MPLVRHPTCMGNRFECVQHGQECKCLAADVHIAGFPCVSYSPQGLRRADKGDDFPHWCCWAAQRRSLEDKVVIYECSHCYDPSNIEEALGDVYIHLHRMVCPSALGFPVTRKRIYGLLISRKHVYEFYHREVPKERRRCQVDQLCARLVKWWTAKMPDIFLTWSIWDGRFLPGI